MEAGGRIIGNSIAIRAGGIGANLNLYPVYLRGLAICG